MVNYDLNGDIGTCSDRAKKLKPCPAGSEGTCCRTCYVGPCRFIGSGAEENVRGVCGSTLGVISSRQFLSMSASGSAIYANHARELALNLLTAARGETKEHAINNWHKLYVIANSMDIGSGEMSKEKIAEEVALRYLEQFSRFKGGLIGVERAPQKRLAIWDRLEIMPRGIDREITEAIYHASVGIDYDAEGILRQALQVAIATGWCSGTMAADIKDIMSGHAEVEAMPSPTSGTMRFAHGYLEQMLRGRHSGSLGSLSKLISSGEIRGIACLVDCYHPRYETLAAHEFAVTELIRNDILVIAGGCNNSIADSASLSPRRVVEIAGNGLKNALSVSGIPPILLLDNCSEHARILTLLSAIAEECKMDDICRVPSTVFTPHWFSGTALSIGSFYAVSGVQAIFGGKSPAAGSKEVTTILTEKWEKQLGAGFSFLEEAGDIVEAIMDHIDDIRNESQLTPYYSVQLK